MTYSERFRRALEAWKVQTNGVTVFQGAREACWAFLHQAGPGDHTMTPDPPNYFREGYKAYDYGLNVCPYTGLEAELWHKGWRASRRAGEVATS